MDREVCEYSEKFIPFSTRSARSTVPCFMSSGNTSSISDGNINTSFKSFKNPISGGVLEANHEVWWVIQGIWRRPTAGCIETKIFERLGDSVVAPI